MCRQVVYLYILFGFFAKLSLILNAKECPNNTRYDLPGLGIQGKDLKLKLHVAATLVADISPPFHAGKSCGTLELNSNNSLRYLKANLTSDVPEEFSEFIVFLACDFEHFFPDSRFCYSERKHWAFLWYCYEGEISALLLTDLVRPSLNESMSWLEYFLNDSYIDGMTSVNDFKFSIGRCKLFDIDLDDVLLISLVIVLISILMMKVALLFVK